MQDRFRRKTKRPTGGGDSSLETIDITKQVPQINDVLAAVDGALEEARQLEKQLRPQGRCGC